jgi:hypothetical protein
MAYQGMRLVIVVLHNRILTYSSDFIATERTGIQSKVADYGRLQTKHVTSSSAP